GKAIEAQLKKGGLAAEDVRSLTDLGKRLGVEVKPVTDAAVPKPTGEPPMADRVSDALGKMKEGGKLNVDPKNLPELQKGLEAYLKDLPPEKAALFLENMQKGIIGLEKPMGE